MASMDTSPSAQRRYVAIFSKMSGEERVAIAVEMAEEVKGVTLAGIRARNAHLSAREVAAEWLRILHGDEVARRVT